MSLLLLQNDARQIWPCGKAHVPVASGSSFYRVVAAVSGDRQKEDEPMHPYVFCRTCKRTRECLKHFRAAHPPSAARKWLTQTCPLPGICDMAYQVGIEPRLTLSTQQDPHP